MAADGQGLFPLETTQFATNLELKLQQKGSKLRGRVNEGFHTGKMDLLTRSPESVAAATALDLEPDTGPLAHPAGHSPGRPGQAGCLAGVPRGQVCDLPRDDPLVPGGVLGHTDTSSRTSFQLSHLRSQLGVCGCSGAFQLPSGWRTRSVSRSS